MYRQPISKTSGLLSKAGILPPILMIGGGIVGLGTYFKATFFLKKYGQLIQLKGDSGPVQPSVKLEDMVLEVCDNLGTSISENTTIRPIIIPGTQTIHAGTLATFQGGIIGLPSFFEFEKIDEVEGKIQWDKTASMDLEEIYNTFLLSDEAKKYGIAREVLLVNTPKVYIGTVIPIAVSYLINQLATNANIESEMAKVPPNLRNCFYVLLFVLGIVVCRSLHMRLQRRYENKAENTISQLGEDYIRGAIEYNTKVIQRNLCSATMKDQNNRVLKSLSDSVKVFFSFKQMPSQKLRFYQSLTTCDDSTTNNK